MSFWTNYPFAFAPAMGINSLFASSVVLDLKLDWRLALMAALLQGLLFMGLCVSGLHDRLVNRFRCLSSTRLWQALVYLYRVLKMLRRPPDDC
jgi:hypothetical protein